LSIVAISGVHWPDDWNSLAELWKGYAVSNKGFGNYRIPLLFVAMLFPLIFTGAGKLSLDHLFSRRFR
jgi:putative oxidoreductase